MRVEEARPVRRILQLSRQDMLVARIRVVGGRGGGEKWSDSGYVLEHGTNMLMDRISQWYHEKTEQSRMIYRILA